MIVLTNPIPPNDPDPEHEPRTRPQEPDHEPDDPNRPADAPHHDPDAPPMNPVKPNEPASQVKGGTP